MMEHKLEIVPSQLVQGAPKAAPPRSTAQAAPAQPAAH